MKITKENLVQIIKENIEAVLNDKEKLPQEVERIIKAIQAELENVPPEKLADALAAINKFYREQLFEAVLKKEKVEIHGSKINGRDVYYEKDQNDKSDAGQRPELTPEKQAEHCRSRRNPGYYSGLRAENVMWDGKRCVYDYPNKE